MWSVPRAIGRIGEVKDAHEERARGGEVQDGPGGCLVHPRHLGGEEAGGGGEAKAGQPPDVRSLSKRRTFLGRGDLSEEKSFGQG